MAKISQQCWVDEWQHCIQLAPEQALAHVQHIAEQHQQDLAEFFYAQMLKDAVASQFLDQNQVRSRLQPSMMRWVVDIFSCADQEGVSRLVAQQSKVGEVHARIDVPVHMVLRGARSLKLRFEELLLANLQEEIQFDADGGTSALALDAMTAVAAVQVMHGVIDLAMEIMSQSYHVSHESSSRADEAYRLHSVTLDLATERESQRAALLDWENQFMFDQAMGVGGTRPHRIGTSNFGLWFRHKGAHLFNGSPETDLILKEIDTVDDVLLPAFNSLAASLVAEPAVDVQAQRMLLMRQLRESMKGIAFHLDSLFTQSREIESGRDVLTRLLTRKFLAVVLGKEIQYARTHQSSFAVLAIDVDFFKRVNDEHGHESGDMVLQQLAAIFNGNCRSGDYTFRLGGEEFLMVLVDVQPHQARQVAEKLRAQVAREPLQVLRDKKVDVRVSIGVAMYSGHPDYQRMVRSADEALLLAKQQGRNRVVMAALPNAETLVLAATSQ